METIETVKIVSDRHERGYVIINKSDYNPSVHELYGVDRKPGRPPADHPRRIK